MRQCCRPIEVTAGSWRRVPPTKLSFIHYETRFYCVIDKFSEHRKLEYTLLFTITLTKLLIERCIEHDTLIHQYGVRGNNLNWIRGFLDGRTQTVVVDGDESTSVPVTSGVPQGSVLGPILFLAYINDLPDRVTSKVRLFADDTALYLSLNKQTQSTSLQQDLDHLQVWEREWDMEFNPGKCQVVRVSRARRPIPSVYHLHGQVLEVVDHAKYLGVDISANLKWNEHIDNICKKATRSLGFVKRNIRTHHPKVREAAYKTLVRPQLEYASSAWDPHTIDHTHKIEMIQRRAARWVLRDYSPLSSVSTMLDRLEWQTLEHRRSCARLTLFYKIVHHLVAVPLPQYLCAACKTISTQPPLWL